GLVADRAAAAAAEQNEPYTKTAEFAHAGRFPANRIMAVGATIKLANTPIPAVRPSDRNAGLLAIASSPNASTVEMQHSTRLATVAAARSGCSRFSARNTP